MQPDAPRFQLETPPRGVLSAGRVDGVLERERLLPPLGLESCVHHCWWLDWDLRSPFKVEALPYPAFQITVAAWSGDAEAIITGLRTRRTVRALKGRGSFFGIQFRPAAFQPRGVGSLARFTDHPVAAERVFGPETPSWARKLLATDNLSQKLALCADFLTPRLKPPCAEVEALRDVIEQLASLRALATVEGIAAELGVDVRTLQRRFQRYVGIGPKWVLQRHRLQEAALRLRQPNAPTLASLASTLGYADQAHFARDFKLATGLAPGKFSKQNR